MGDPLLYYEIVAGVIPVLYLALLFQANLLEDSPMLRPRTQIANQSWPRRKLEPRLPWLYSHAADDVVAAFFALYLLLIAGIGEYVCLHALYVGKPPGHSTRPVVAMSLFASALTLTYQQFMLAIAKRQEARNETASASVRLYGQGCYFTVLALGLLVLSA